MAHAYNTNYWGGSEVWGQPRENESETLSQKVPNT
jgi:hypothetical protein